MRSNLPIVLANELFLSLTSGVWLLLLFTYFAQFGFLKLGRWLQPME